MDEVTVRMQCLHIAADQLKNHFGESPDKIAAFAAVLERFANGKPSIGMVLVDRAVMDYFAGRDCEEKGAHVTYDVGSDAYVKGPSLSGAPLPGEPLKAVA